MFVKKLKSHFTLIMQTQKTKNSKCDHKSNITYTCILSRFTQGSWFLILAQQHLCKFLWADSWEEKIQSNRIGPRCWWCGRGRRCFWGIMLRVKKMSWQRQQGTPRPVWRFYVFGSGDTKQMACSVRSGRFNLWPCFIMHTHINTHEGHPRWWGGLMWCELV